MSKLIIMKGLPGCGKSTRAEEIVRASGNTVRLTKDLLREMLHYNRPDKPGYKFIGRQEQEVRDLERDLAIRYIAKGKNVIIDDTNLNPKTLNAWITLANQIGAKHEIIDMTGVSWSDCCMFDRARQLAGQRWVGSTVIKNMGIQWGLITFKPNSVVICDIDGTLADNSHRNHLVTNLEEGQKKDWKEWYARMGEDKVRLEVQKQIIDEYNSGKTIILVSGRSANWKKETEDWLHKNYLTFPFTLIMRGENDHREDTLVKQDILNTYFKDKQVISKVYDDRPRVIRMWRENGLEVVDVGDGKEF